MKAWIYRFPDSERGPGCCVVELRRNALLDGRIGTPGNNIIRTRAAIAEDDWRYMRRWHRRADNTVVTEGWYQWDDIAPLFAEIGG